MPGPPASVRLQRLARQLLLTSDPVAASATPTSENEAEFLMESYGGKVPDYPFIGELSRDQVEETVNTLKIQGYAIIPHCIEPEVLMHAHQACIDLHHGNGLGMGQGMQEQDGKTRNMLLTNLHGRDSRFWPLICSSNVLQVVRKIVGQDALLSSTNALWKRPGASEQHLHTDDLLYASNLFFPRPLPAQLSVVAMVALQDITAGNGATKIFPYSHTWEQRPFTADTGFSLTMKEGMDQTGFQPLVNLRSEAWARENGKPDPIRGEMPRGSVLFWMGGAWHGGGAYTDPEGPDRAAVILNFCRSFLRREEETMMQVPHELAAKMPVDLQRMIGYASPKLGGFIQDGKPHYTLLGEEGSRALREWESQGGRSGGNAIQAGSNPDTKKKY